MSKEELIEVQGKVIDNLPQGKFKVELCLLYTSDAADEL